MVTSIINGAYQEITKLDTLAKQSPLNSPTRRNNVGEIERIVDGTEDKTTFVYGLRVLSSHAYPPDYLDKKVEVFNATRAQPHFRVEGYHIAEPDGSYTLRKV